MWVIEMQRATLCNGSRQEPYKSKWIRIYSSGNPVVGVETSERQDLVTCAELLRSLTLEARTGCEYRMLYVPK